MDEPIPAPSRDPPPSWSYVNYWRMLASFLGASMVLLGVGVLAVTGAGSEAAFGAGVLLAVAVFVTVFALLLLFPRVARRGPVGYRIVVERPLVEVEGAVREALEGAGRSVHVDVLAGRTRRTPARVVRVEGTPCRFLVEAVSLRESGDGVERTEVLQVGLEETPEGAAKELRDLVGSGVVTPQPAGP